MDFLDFPIRLTLLHLCSVRARQSEPPGGQTIVRLVTRPWDQLRSFRGTFVGGETGGQGGRGFAKDSERAPSTRIEMVGMIERWTRLRRHQRSIFGTNLVEGHTHARSARRRARSIVWPSTTDPATTPTPARRNFQGKPTWLEEEHGRRVADVADMAVARLWARLGLCKLVS